MHLSQYPMNPALLDDVLNLVRAATWELGDTKLIHKKNGFPIVVLRLRDAADLDAARDAVLAAGAREDGQRGSHTTCIMGYKGRMIRIDAPEHDLKRSSMPSTRS